MHGSDCFGLTKFATKSSADFLEDEDAAAVILWTTSLTPRVLGSISKSFVNVRTMPPVADDRQCLLSRK